VNEYDYYRILGVDREATAVVIQQAYEALIADIPAELRTIDNPTYQRVISAYEVLNDPSRRATYDSLLIETSDPILKVAVQASREKVPILGSPQLLYLLVDVRPPEQESKSNLPLNLALAIDRSTSMNGARLERVKAAVNLIIDQLGPEDVLSVVSFSDRAEIVLPASNINNKVALSAKIRNMQASGGTEIYHGLAAGVSQLRQVPLNKYLNHLILLTDGHTYGDVNKCLELAQETASQGIGFSAFGIGSEWNDQFLDKLVSPSGGRSDYIEQPEQIITFLQNRINGLGDVYAQNVRLQLDFPSTLNLSYGFKLVPFAQPLHPDRHEIKLGNIEGRAPLKFLLEINLLPQAIETRINIPINIIADIPSQQKMGKTYKTNFQLYVLSDPPPEEPPMDLLKAVRVLNMYRLNEKVWNEVEAGQLETATRRMRHLTTRLLEAGETKLAQQAHSETIRLTNMEQLSEEGRKRLKYGTRAMFTGKLDIDFE